LGYHLHDVLLLPRVEVHLFILWERARASEARILDDIEASFRVLDVVDVTWSPEHFTRSLVRFYGDALPPAHER